MSKPFQPVVVKPDAFYLSDAYGITDERRDQLCEKMTRINEEMMGTISPVYYRIDRLAQICETAGEFAYCLHVDTVVLERQNANLV